MSELDIPKSGKCRVCVNGEWRIYVFYMRGSKQCWRLWVKPRDPRTPGQLGSRARFGAASNGYSNSRQLTEEDRSRLRAAGAKVRSRLRLGQSGPLTGQQYHIRITCTGAGRAEGRIGDAGAASQVQQCPRFARATSERYRSITVAVPRRVAGVLGAFPVLRAPELRGCWADEVDAAGQWQGAVRGQARPPPGRELAERATSLAS